MTTVFWLVDLGDEVELIVQGFQGCIVRVEGDIVEVVAHDVKLLADFYNFSNLLLGSFVNSHSCLRRSWLCNKPQVQELFELDHTTFPLPNIYNIRYDHLFL